MPTPTLSDEVTYVSGIDANGKVAATSFETWTGDHSPALDVSRHPPSDVNKWGSTTPGTAGGTVSVYFDSGSPPTPWSATEKAAFIAVLDLWAAVANISFTIDTSTPSDESTFENNY